MKRKERITDAEKKEAYKEASKFVLDIAKLVFAGIILGGIMDMDISKAALLSVGGIVAFILTIGGAYLYYKAIKKYEAYGVFNILRSCWSIWPWYYRLVCL